MRHLIYLMFGLADFPDGLVKSRKKVGFVLVLTDTTLSIVATASANDCVEWPFSKRCKSSQVCRIVSVMCVSAANCYISSGNNMRSAQNNTCVPLASTFIWL